MNGDIILVDGDTVKVRSKVKTWEIRRGKDSIEKRETELTATWQQYDKRKGWQLYSEPVEAVEAAIGQPVVITRSNGARVTLPKAQRIICSTRTGGYEAEGFWAGPS